MSFDVFENIFTASDPAGGRAIKVSALAGIDNAESYYTQNDPAGGRAIKVKIIAGGASTGTLQVAGGVALDSTVRNITDSASPTANPSALYLSTGNVVIKPNLSNLTDNLLLIDSDGFSGVNPFIRLNNNAGTAALVRFSYGSAPYNNIGDFRADSINGVSFNASWNNTNVPPDTVNTVSYPINFYVREASRLAMKIVGGLTGTAGDVEMYYALSVTGEASAQSFRLTGTGGAGHLHLRHQSGDPTIGSATSTVLYSDNPGNLRLKNGANNFTTTFSSSANGQNSTYTFPNVASTTLAGLSVAQTFTSAQTISNSAIGPSFIPSLTLLNPTAAASAANNQWSPGLVLQGSFWTGSASVTGAFRTYVKQTTNTSAGVGHLVFGYSNNGGAETESFRISHSGAIFINNSAGFVANMGGSSGIVRLTDGSGNAATNARIQLGDADTTAPMIRRNGANLEVRFGSDAYGSGFSVGGALVASAILQADSTTKGFLPPRMTTGQRTGITSPAAGLIVYDTSFNKLYVFTTGWEQITSA